MGRRRGRSGSRGRKRGGSRWGLLTNRRSPSLGWVSPYDIWLNAKERLYCWLWRVPQGSYIAWDRNGKIKGHSTRAKRPWF